MKERFWKQSWDPGLEDVDPQRFNTSYVEVIRPAFAQHPRKAALAYMGTEITFGELDRASNRFAHMLLAQGLRKGDVVGINLPNIPEYVIAWLGTLKAGCVVSGVSPLLSAEEMEYQLADARARGLVTLDAIFAARLVTIAPRLPDLKVVVAASVGGFLPPVKRVLGKLLGKIPKGAVGPLEGRTVLRMEAVIRGPRFSDGDPGVPVGPDDAAYLQYTGGTTGLPKGAVLSHRNAVADLIIVQTWLQWQFGSGPALSAFPLFHIAGLFFCANCVFLAWTQILIPNPRDTDHICRELGRYRPIAVVNVPSLWQMLIANPRFATLDHSRLECCISSASPFPAEDQEKLEAVVGPGKLLEVYGMTETAPLTVMNPAKGPKKLGSIGLPILNTDLKLIEPGGTAAVPPGQPGEIWVRGPQVMVGYHDNPEETRNAIDAEGFMHTGDVAVMDAKGYLQIVDRTKDMLIVGGFKVFSRKVEDVLAQHPAVEMVAIVGRPNPSARDRSWCAPT
jgi:long-chain acyl-CoA synthetase